mmetsp:Transcript_16650/g.52438  ORF Transcript_16650/g.52438 Transcript_16650/m.52438 type:complete len:241 (-) Transcript_16650:317-1039(-)
MRCVSLRHRALWPGGGATASASALQGACSCAGGARAGAGASGGAGASDGADARAAPRRLGTRAGGPLGQRRPCTRRSGITRGHGALHFPARALASRGARGAAHGPLGRGPDVLFLLLQTAQTCLLKPPPAVILLLVEPDVDRGLPLALAIDPRSATRARHVAGARFRERLRFWCRCTIDRPNTVLLPSLAPRYRLSLLPRHGPSFTRRRGGPASSGCTPGFGTALQVRRPRGPRPGLALL